MEDRIRCTWLKIKMLQISLTNQHISIRKRSQLFEVVIAPTFLYGIETCALKKTELDHADQVFRRMVRKTIGWICECETCEEGG